MDTEYVSGKTAPLRSASGRKVRITIRVDRDIVDWFRGRVKEQGGGSYQAMVNDALHRYIQSREQPLEETLRRVIREELHADSDTDAD
jgi:uncharacterized protein (DUF4415 family)